MMKKQNPALMNHFAASSFSLFVFAYFFGFEVLHSTHTKKNPNRVGSPFKGWRVPGARSR
jgi:hypothetical protein